VRGEDRRATNVRRVPEGISRVSAMSRGQFVATHDSVRKRRIPNGAADRCVVNRDGTRCAAPALAWDCVIPTSSFRYVARTKGRSLQDWLPRAHPYSDARSECLVIGWVSWSRVGKNYVNTTGRVTSSTAENGPLGVVPRDDLDAARRAPRQMIKNAAADEHH